MPKARDPRPGFGERLRVARESLNLSQTQLAEAAERVLVAMAHARGLSEEEIAKHIHLRQATISKYELGTVDDPSALALSAIAKVLDVPMEDLLGSPPDAIVPNTGTDG